MSLRERSAEYLIVIAITYAGILVSTVRWLRVAQREHYIPGSVAEFAVRWWTFHSGNLLLLLSYLVLASLSFVHPFWGTGATWFLVFLPAGLTLRGRTSKLAWTPRMRRLAGIVAAFYGVAGVAGYLGGRIGYTIFVFSGLTAPAVVDLGLAITAPVERLLSDKFIKASRQKLDRVMPLVVALTGSYGKTTTKRYTEHLLSGFRRVFATPASFNNRLGIARAINESMPHSTEVFVVELGTYGPGEIADLCSWLKPKIVGFLAVGPVHLERFGSIEAIASAKAEILRGAQVVVANADDPLVAAKVKEHTSGEQDREVPRVLWYSCKDPAADVFVDVSGEKGRIFHKGTLLGSFDASRHIAYNVAAAVELALAAGCKPEEISRRLDTLPAVEHRRAVERSQKGTLVVDNTFNSNPAGVRESLKLLESLRTEGSRVVVVTPGMVELGDIQFEENLKFASEVCEKGFELVIVGFTNRKALLEGARAAGREARIFDTRDEAVAWVRDNLKGGDVVLYENDLPDHYP